MRGGGQGHTGERARRGGGHQRRESSPNRDQRLGVLGLSSEHLVVVASSELEHVIEHGVRRLGLRHLSHDVGLHDAEGVHHERLGLGQEDVDLALAHASDPFDVFELTLEESPHRIAVLRGGVPPRRDEGSLGEGDDHLKHGFDDVELVLGAAQEGFGRPQVEERERAPRAVEERKGGDMAFEQK